MAMVEEIDIVIVGGGICGLATSLALHRKGIKSVVLERSETLRATGAAITIFANGWRALHQLGLDSKLRSTSIIIERFLEVDLDNKDELRETPISDGEARCLKRIDLVEALANELPPGTIRFGCQVVSIDVESSSSSPILTLHNGTLIKAKVLIGCDGANSGVANFVGLKPIQPFLRSAVRGVTTYPSGHGFAPAFLRLKKDQCLVGRIPMNETSVYWFVFIQENEKDVKMSKDPESIKQVALDSTVDFSTDVVEMVNNSDLTSLSLTKLTCRAPWNLLRGTFRREAATVAGDAWHVMGPFAGQGGSAALEDAIELARCLSKRISRIDVDGMLLSERKAREALDEYIKSRRLRVLYLSTLTYIRGLLSVGNPSLLVTLLCIAIMRVVFRDPMKHTRYDCGEL